MESTENIQLNIVICDDEPIMVEQLVALCNSTLEEVCAAKICTAQSPGELLTVDIPFHIAILDVQLMESNGIELARAIFLRNPGCRVIFVSGFLHAVSEVYEVPHFCFILKDQLAQQFPRFLKRAAQEAVVEAGQTLLIQSGKQTEKWALADISVLERRGHWTYITASGGREIKTKEKLGDLLRRMSAANFCRCHISYAVNLRHVQTLELRTFVMTTGEKIPISRPNEQAAREAFFRYIKDHIH